jgi:hypothetical protein
LVHSGEIEWLTALASILFPANKEVQGGVAVRLRYPCTFPSLHPEQDCVGHIVSLSCDYAKTLRNCQRIDILCFHARIDAMV